MEPKGPMLETFRWIAHPASSSSEKTNWIPRVYKKSGVNNPKSNIQSSTNIQAAAAFPGKHGKLRLEKSLKK